MLSFHVLPFNCMFWTMMTMMLRFFVLEESINKHNDNIILEIDMGYIV